MYVISLNFVIEQDRNSFTDDAPGELKGLFLIDSGKDRTEGAQGF